MVKLIFKSHSGDEKTLQIPEQGSVMEAALANNVAEITADCGGSMVCGTCHVTVDPEWQNTLPEQSSMEKDILEYVPKPQPNSRLSCQIPVTAALDGIVLHLPESQY
ncbi:2Fe-2S iron-sulfur cluster-binding protein [Zhongshania sp.]|uniref:2Fe-2S iron-sulfur cluster-binding protein n=1 Tax=Zhongshania sp. TaxID=1971902 RepID=UPI001B619215|nr:2Fe-2S iron-sulfur cluster-binding protein [Zhongshania sp.]MBQ0794887.1 2Fe-2S iron-sulfur cluster binding domain-containing protein [Zhongshania sp.]